MSPRTKGPSPREPWPGEPEQVWAASADAPAARRRSAPDVLTNLEVFGTRVRTPNVGRGSGVVLGILGVAAAIYVVGFDFPERVREQGFLWAIFLGNPWYVDIIAWAVLVVAVYKVATAFRPRTDPEARTRELFEEAKRAGYLASVHDSGYRVLADESGEWEVRYAVDLRIDDAQAGRLHAAFDAWVERLQADRSADTTAKFRLYKEAPLHSEEIFGPGAEGAYVFLEGLPIDLGMYRWLLLVPDEQELAQYYVR